MVKTLAIEKVTLYDLEQTFHLQRVEDPDFFHEWQHELPSLTTSEQERLPRIEAVYANLA